MDPAFRGAPWGPTGHVVLGLPLYPLTVGHVFLLTELGVDFLADNIEPGFEDLLMFTFVASQPTAVEASKAVSSRWREWFFWLWGRASRRKKWSDEMAKLHAYLRSQQVAPVVANPPAGQEMRRLNAPEHWRLLCMLMVDFHMPEADALNVTLNRGRALWGVEGERQLKHTLAWTPDTAASLARLAARKERDGPS
jgi:hypothetical protein